MGGTQYFVLRQGGGRIFVTSLHFTMESAQGSQFECTVLETLAKFGKRLDFLTPRVEGSDSLSLTPSGASQASEPSRDWGVSERDMDKQLNDYSAILTWYDEESGEARGD